MSCTAYVFYIIYCDHGVASLGKFVYWLHACYTGGYMYIKHKTNVTLQSCTGAYLSGFLVTRKPPPGFQIQYTDN